MQQFRKIVILVAAAAITLPAMASATEGLVRQPIGPRAPAQVQQGWPLKRPPREVVVRDRSRGRGSDHGQYDDRGGDRVRDDDRGRGRRRDDYRDDYRGSHHRPVVRFYPPVFFVGTLYNDRLDVRREYWRDRSLLVWEDSESLYGDEGWVEFTLDCRSLGRRLWFEVRDGRVRIDWAEIVYENGDAQVVDFSERSIGPGVYLLDEFRAARGVVHVRMVAEAGTREVRLILRMER